MLSRRLALLLAGAALAAAVPAAHADSIVYLKDGNVWIAQPDGSGARQFTVNTYNWRSPSEADDGTVVVAGGLQRVNADGSDSSGASELYRFSSDGNQLGGAIPTWGSTSTPACPTYGPLSVRVSPDASKIAYGIWSCGDAAYTALWTPATATGLSFPNQTLGQQDYYEPAWVDSAQFLVSHVGPTVTDSQARWYVHDVATGDGASNGAWAEPSMTGTGAQGVISRDGKEFAVFEDDAANWMDGKPRTVSLWLYHSSYGRLPGAGEAWTHDCTVSLNAAGTSDPLHLSPSFSPDGTKLLWGDDAGVEVASVANLADCSSVVPHLLIAGGSQPFYGKGNVAPPAANPTQPGGTTPAPGGGGSTTPGGGGTSTNPTPPPPAPMPAGPTAAFVVRTHHARAGRKVVFDARGSAESGGKVVSYTWSFGDHAKLKTRKPTATHRYKKAKTYMVTLTVTDAAGHTATARHRVKVAR